MVFADREDAGRRLAVRLERLRGEPAVVLGLPRGGVPVAFQVARALGAPLDVIVVRKLGVPFQPELAMGAVGEGGVRVIRTCLAPGPGFPAPGLNARERAGQCVQLTFTMCACGPSQPTPASTDRGRWCT